MTVLKLRIPVSASVYARNVGSKPHIITSPRRRRLSVTGPADLTSYLNPIAKGGGGPSIKRDDLRQIFDTKDISTCRLLNPVQIRYPRYKRFQYKFFGKRTKASDGLVTRPTIDTGWLLEFWSLTEHSTSWSPTPKVQLLKGKKQKPKKSYAPTLTICYNLLRGKRRLSEPIPQTPSPGFDIHLLCQFTF